VKVGKNAGKKAVAAVGKRKAPAVKSPAPRAAKAAVAEVERKLENVKKENAALHKKLQALKQGQVKKAVGTAGRKGVSKKAPAKSPVMKKATPGKKAGGARVGGPGGRKAPTAKNLRITIQNKRR